MSYCKFLPLLFLWSEDTKLFCAVKFNLREQKVCYLLQLLEVKSTCVTRIDTHAYLFLSLKASLFIGIKIQAVGLKGS